jgi:hypothetical protein
MILKLRNQVSRVWIRLVTVRILKKEPTVGYVTEEIRLDMVHSLAISVKQRDEPGITTYIVGKNVLPEAGVREVGSWDEDVLGKKSLRCVVFSVAVGH